MTEPDGPLGGGGGSDPVCTACGGTGITYQTERRCACTPTDDDVLLRRADVIAMLRRLSSEAADMALEEGSERARACESQEAAYSRAMYAIAFLPASPSPPGAVDREEKAGWVANGMIQAAEYLEGVASGKEVSARGGIGGMFANQSAADLRAAADELRRRVTALLTTPEK